MSQTIADSNLIGNDQPSMTLRNFKLLSRRKAVVACGRAYIGDEPQLIHYKPLLNDAYKIIVDIVNKGDVELPELDEYHSTLGEVGSRSIVAWHKRVRALQSLQISLTCNIFMFGVFVITIKLGNSCPFSFYGNLND